MEFRRGQGLTLCQIVALHKGVWQSRCPQDRSRIAPLHRRRDAVHGDAAEKLGIKIRGFLRQNFAGSGDFHDLFDAAWIQEEGDLRAARIDGVQSSGGFAFVGEMSLSGDSLRGNTESGLEDSFVEEDDVEFAL